MNGFYLLGHARQRGKDFADSEVDHAEIPILLGLRAKHLDLPTISSLAWPRPAFPITWCLYPEV